MWQQARQSAGGSRGCETRSRVGAARDVMGVTTGV